METTKNSAKIAANEENSALELTNDTLMTALTNPVPLVLISTVVPNRIGNTEPRPLANFMGRTFNILETACPTGSLGKDICSEETKTQGEDTDVFFSSLPSSSG